MSTTTTTTTTTPRARPRAIKRPVAQRNDSTLEVHDKSTSKRRPKVIATAAATEEAIEAKKTTTTPKAQLQSRLFRLPYELRLMIYEFALPTAAVSCPPPLRATSPSTTPTSSTTQRTTTTTSTPQDLESAIEHHDDASGAEPAFLRTCHLARTEGLPIFYRDNDFLLNRRPSLDFQHPLLISMNPSLLSTTRKTKKTSGSRWLYSMSSASISRIRTVVFAQVGRGMYKDERNGWRRDASACFRVRFLSPGDSRRVNRDYEVQYLRIDPSGRSERYAERLVKALETRMEQLAGNKGVRAWTREDIWDLAYLL
ncbi:hypothetical protein AAFC00_002179 [Neodothiora populina]|uniref:DUF7730 domain-containing protein n=1 Tax=Neodothiora populina TaxID=2781224 RepID=A0ABR3PGI4_9PEZI